MHRILLLLILLCAACLVSAEERTLVEAPPCSGAKDLKRTNEILPNTGDTHYCCPVKPTVTKTVTKLACPTSTPGCGGSVGYGKNLKYRWLVDPKKSNGTFTNCVAGGPAATVTDPKHVRFPLEQRGRFMRRVMQVDEHPAGLTVPPDIGALGTSDFTITMWTQMGLDVPYETRLQRWELFSNRGPGDLGHWISIRARNYDDSITFDLNDGPAQKGIVGTVALNSTLPGGALDFEWHLLAFSRRGPRISIFVDGVLVATEKTRGGYTADLQSSGYAVGIGHSPYYSDSFAFRGRMDDVRVYGEALTGAKMKRIMAAYLG